MYETHRASSRLGEDGARQTSGESEVHATIGKGP